MLLVLSIGSVAIGSGSGLIPLPYEMFELAGRTPYVFRAHMESAALALLLAPIVISFRHRPHIHRILGRVLGAFVVAGGLTALPVAIFSHSTLAARAGFFAQGIVWMVLLARGVAAIRQGHRAKHARLMLAMVAVTTGAIWFRLMTGTAILLHLPFDAIYAAAAWLGWLVPLGLVLAFPAFQRSFLQPSPLPSPRLI